MGARVSFATGKPVVTDGPFTEAKEVLGGYWMIDVASRDEAIAWAKKCPASENEMIEIRQVQEMADFSDDVQQAPAGFAELQGPGGAPLGRRSINDRAAGGRAAHQRERTDLSGAGCRSRGGVSFR